MSYTPPHKTVKSPAKTEEGVLKKEGEGSQKKNLKEELNCVLVDSRRTRLLGGGAKKMELRNLRRSGETTGDLIERGTRTKHLANRGAAVSAKMS